MRYAYPLCWLSFRIIALGPVMDAGLVKAARSAIEVLLKLKGNDIVLLPAKGTRTEQPGGGYKYAATAPRVSQRFSISDRTGRNSAKSTGESDVTVLVRTLDVVGRYNAVAEIGDEWSDSEARYRIDELIIDNQYQKRWLATQIGQGSNYG